MHYVVVLTNTPKNSSNKTLVATTIATTNEKADQLLLLALSNTYLISGSSVTDSVYYHKLSCNNKIALNSV